MHGVIYTNYKVMGFSIYEQGEGMGSSTPTSSARFTRAKNLPVKNAIKNNIFYTKFDYTQLRTMEKLLMKNVYMVLAQDLMRSAKLNILFQLIRSRAN